MNPTEHADLVNRAARRLAAMTPSSNKISVETMARDAVIAVLAELDTREIARAADQGRRQLRRGC